MNECEKCYKLSRCYEQRGRCSEYRNIEDIRAEIEAVMRAYKVAASAEAGNEECKGEQEVQGNSHHVKGLLLSCEDAEH